MKRCNVQDKILAIILGLNLKITIETDLLLLI